LFNEAYYHRHQAGRHKGIVDYEPFFYTLDGLLCWNRIYGPKGFQQYQCVIPDSEAEAAIGNLLATIAAKGGGSFLAVMKRCGAIASPGLLSFPMPGVSLALDFPLTENLNRLFSRLDAIVRDAKGRLYPAKDAHMSGANFRNFYPNWEQIEVLRDPSLCSRFWNRVTT
jgi:FAD/FMN-containing dehydrogenase